MSMDTDPGGTIDAQGKWRRVGPHASANVEAHALSAPSAPMGERRLSRPSGSYFAQQNRATAPTRGDPADDKWVPPVGYVPPRYKDLSPNDKVWGGQSARAAQGSQPSVGERLVLLKLALTKLAEKGS